MVGVIFWLSGAITAAYIACRMIGNPLRSHDALTGLILWIMTVGFSWGGVLLQLSAALRDYVEIHKTNSQENELDSWKKVLGHCFLGREYTYDWSHVKPIKMMEVS